MKMTTTICMYCTSHKQTLYDVKTDEGVKKAIVERLELEGSIFPSRVDGDCNCAINPRGTFAKLIFYCLY